MAKHRRILGFVVFLSFIRGFLYAVWPIFFMGILLVLGSYLFVEWQSHFTLPFIAFLHRGFVSHIIFWKTFFTQGLGTALEIVYQQAFYYLLGFPLLLASLLGITEWIPHSSHEWELKAIQRGRELSQRNP